MGEWRADPTRRHQHRFWDNHWTDHVADNGVASSDPYPEGPPPLPPRAGPLGWWRAQNTALHAVLIVGAFLGLAALVNAAGGSGDTAATSSTRSYGAYQACKSSVTDRLKSPTSASFSSFEDSAVTVTGSRYKVAGTVDAENSFGASIRMTFLCSLRLTEHGDQLNYEALSVDVA
ncbi:MAG TPA: hypothetical protein VK481_11390 [Gemmatimonadaceae bacterium]|nr:hypothetical protein [Gemmatimonadaceae bacterium]